jgi:hypothetical protein
VAAVTRLLEPLIHQAVAQGMPFLRIQAARIMFDGKTCETLDDIDREQNDGCTELIANRMMAAGWWDIATIS